MNPILLSRIGQQTINLAWSQAARDAALEARRANGKAVQTPLGISQHVAFGATEKAEDASRGAGGEGSATDHDEASTAHRIAADSHAEAAIEANKAGNNADAAEHSRMASYHNEKSEGHAAMANDRRPAKSGFFGKIGGAVKKGFNTAGRVMDQSPGPWNGFGSMK